MYNNTFTPNKIYNPYGPSGYLNPFSQPQNIYSQPQIPQPVQQQANNQQQNGFNIIPVANADEAKAVQTPFDGSILILPNINNGKIYTKQLNMNTGAAIFNEYSINTPITNVKTTESVYVTQQDLDDLRQELLETIDNLNNIQQASEIVDKNNKETPNTITNTTKVRKI